MRDFLHLSPGDGDDGGSGGTGDAGGSGDTGQGTGGSGEGSGGSGDTFEPITSQADLDRLLGRRLRDERARFADYDDLKVKAAKLDEIEAANQSELEKLQKKAADAEAARERAESSARETTVRSAIIAEAVRQKAIDPDAVASLVPVSSIEVDAEGRPQGVEEAVKSLLAEKAYLVGDNGGAGRRTVKKTDADQGARSGGGSGDQLSREDLSTMTPEQIYEANKAGRLQTVKAGATDD